MAALAGLPPAIRAAQGSPEPAVPLDPAELEYWHINTETFGLPTVRSLIDGFQAANPGVTVAERFHENAYTGLLENLQIALAAQRPPDVAQIGFLYRDYVVENFPFASAQSLAEEFGPADLFGAYAENVLDLGRVDGELVAMPYAISNMVAYYNADLLRQAGVDPDSPPTTWEAWAEASRAVRQSTGKAGFFMATVDNWATQALVESAGGRFVGCEGGEARAAFASPEAVQAIQFWADLVEEGAALNVPQAQGVQAFQAGEVAVLLQTIASRASLQEQAAFDLRAVGAPSFGGNPVRIPAGGNLLFVLAEDPARRRAAWEFVTFLESPESLTAWTRGTGYLPPRDGVADDPRYLGAFLAENPIQRVAVEQLPAVVPWTIFPGPNGLRASQVLTDAVEAALGGQRAAEDALSAAAGEVDGLIAGQPCP